MSAYLTLLQLCRIHLLETASRKQPACPSPSPHLMYSALRPLVWHGQRHPRPQLQQHAVAAVAKQAVGVGQLWGGVLLEQEVEPEQAGGWVGGWVCWWVG
jgi:hypothetical protein